MPKAEEKYPSLTHITEVELILLRRLLNLLASAPEGPTLDSLADPFGFGM